MTTSNNASPAELAAEIRRLHRFVLHHMKCAEACTRGSEMHSANLDHICIGTMELHNTVEQLQALAEAGQGEPVAEVGPVFQLLWASDDTISDIVRRSGVKVGSLLYTRPAAEVEGAEVREALRALLSLVRRDAPHLSGKVMGYAEAALSSPATSAAPQATEVRKPLTVIEITTATAGIVVGAPEFEDARDYDIAIARAIERAHGITDSEGK
jgi:hypothetical protein